VRLGAAGGAVRLRHVRAVLPRHRLERVHRDQHGPCARVDLVLRAQTKKPPSVTWSHSGLFEGKGVSTCRVIAHQVYSQYQMAMWAV
jgi:hypothetical protein